VKGEEFKDGEDFQETVVTLNGEDFQGVAGKGESFQEVGQVSRYRADFSPAAMVSISRESIY
jgi:hypothetical protein